MRVTESQRTVSGPLRGFRVVEMAGIGPGPFCAMMLSDMGADVIRIDRKGGSDTTGDPATDVMGRGRRSIALNLKEPTALEVARDLIASADVLIEGFRPGVMERLGLGPQDCHTRNPRLVYGRMTGWGQDGPLAKAAGHDINYIALTGALHSIGNAEGPPLPPLNLVGDFGGGAAMLAFGIACAVIETQRSGLGQVVDAAMVDGSALLMAFFYGMKARGRWQARGSNVLDGAAPFYACYECADGKWLALGSIEPQFYALLMKTVGLEEQAASLPQMDRSGWPQLRALLADRFATRTRDEWCALMEGTDICFAPVLDLDEAPDHAHNRARGVFTEVAGVTQPAPAPRFSRTPGAVQGPPTRPGSHTEDVLAELGLSPEAIAQLRQSGAI
ncbi:CaiB/BaiF CoA-transferase family protein [Variovorax sp. OV084]|uniref:CaiB/BaiF CoA transferase family protein n=1 Tax=Variovorax sp. OV084 TaxID=1882777 RepID=UPI0008AC8103|nr:CaiB/BaiF CoA-transferase family protein [Variovorax sp. OV084]SEU04277.1 alpha-methylacyl-CoA racemase [Variovorax sp. OV084]